MENNWNEVVWVWNTTRVNNWWQNFGFNQEDAEYHWTVGCWSINSWPCETYSTDQMLLWQQTSTLRRKWKSPLKGHTSWDSTSVGILEYRAKVEETCQLGFPQSQQGSCAGGVGCAYVLAVKLIPASKSKGNAIPHARSFCLGKTSYTIVLSEVLNWNTCQRPLRTECLLSLYVFPPK